jgi:Zn-dependent membrane protease YugP
MEINNLQIGLPPSFSAGPGRLQSTSSTGGLAGGYINSERREVSKVVLTSAAVTASSSALVALFELVEHQPVLQFAIQSSIGRPLPVGFGMRLQ